MGILRQLLVGTFLALAGAIPAAAQDLTGAVWSVCGYDGQYTWHETRLVFETQSPGSPGWAVSGYFDWRSSGGHTGRERFNGTLSPSGALSLLGHSLEGETSIVTSRYLADVSHDGQTIVRGVWLDGVPGVWAAVRDGGAGTAQGLCEAEAQLS